MAPRGNAMSWRKLATGSGSTGVIIADSDVSGAMENMIARSAFLNRSSMGAVCWEFDGEADDRAAVTALAGALDEV